MTTRTSDGLAPARPGVAPRGAPSTVRISRPWLRWALAMISTSFLRPFRRGGDGERAAGGPGRSGPSPGRSPEPSSTGAALQAAGALPALEALPRTGSLGPPGPAPVALPGPTPDAAAVDLPRPPGGLAPVVPRSGEATIEVRMPDHGARIVPKAVLLAVYVAAVLGPMALVLLQDEAEPRPFVAEFGSALGIAALSLLALQLVLPARLPLLASIGAEVAVRLHRRLADVLIAVVAAHIAAVMVADPARLELLRFFGEPWRAQAAIASVVALAALAGTSVLRRRLHLSYAGWRGIHLVLAIGALVLAVIHTVGVNRYLVRGAAEWSLLALTVAGIGGLLALRSHWIRRGSVRPYRVERVVDEGGGAITVHLRADGHRGQQFIPGQFAWLKPPGVRTLLAEHPFSYVSSAESPSRPAFTMKTRGGFTAAAAEFAPGTALLVDGPHGAFRPRAAAAGLLLVAGGIGITPSMSVLRTAADRGDRRPHVLVFAARTPDALTFSDELEALRSRLDLDVVRVLSAPPPDWTGERGRIDRSLLDRHLPADLRGWQVLVCGPGPFVDGAMEALEAVGIPGERVHAERFVEV